MSTVRFKCATYNIVAEKRHTYEKICRLAEFADENKMQVVTITSTKLPTADPNPVKVGNYFLYQKGFGDGKNTKRKRRVYARAGVAILVRSDIEVESWNLVSERIIFLQTKGVWYIVAYGPACRSISNYKKFLSTLKSKIHEKCEEVGFPIKPILMGDFNAWVGNTRPASRNDAHSVSSGSVVGWFGQHKINEKGKLLIKFCRDMGLLIANTHRCADEDNSTFFTRRNNKDIKTLVDYIIIPNDWKFDWKTYIIKNTGIISDHNMVVFETGLSEIIPFLRSYGRSE